MKITDFKNEEAIDLLADIIEPVTKILGDKQIATAVKNKVNRLTIAKMALKNHKSEVVEILALCNGCEVKDYTCNIITITKDLLELLNDKELMDFFQSQQQMMANESSMSAMENTMENAQ